MGLSRASKLFKLASQQRFCGNSADGLPWKVAAYTHQGPGGQAAKNPVFRPSGLAVLSANKGIDVYDENNAFRCGNPVNRLVVRGRHSL